MEKKRLEEIRTLLINVDMVNGFVVEGPMSDSYIQHIIEPQIEIIEILKKEKAAQIAFIKEAHEKECEEFKRYPKHCVKGTFEAELVKQLKLYEQDALLYEKNSTSAIFANKFMTDIEKMKKLREVIVTGCCTDICVMDLAVPLKKYFDQVDQNVAVIIPKNAVETFDSPTHNREEWNEIAFKVMEQAGIQLVKSYNFFRK